MKTPRYRAVSSSIWLLSLSLSINNRVERHPRATKRDPPPRLLLSLWIGRFVKWWLENVKETSSRTSCVSWDKEEEEVVVVCCTPSFSRNGSRVCSTCLDCSWRKRRFQNSCSSKSESGSESGSKFSDISFPFLPLSLFSSPVNWSHLQIPRERERAPFIENLFVPSPFLRIEIRLRPPISLTDAFLPSERTGLN